MGKPTLVFVVAFAVFNPVLAYLGLILAIGGVLLHHAHHISRVGADTLTAVSWYEGRCTRLAVIEGLSWNGRWRIRDEGRLEGWGRGREGRRRESLSWHELLNSWCAKAARYERLGRACRLQVGGSRSGRAHRLTTGRVICRVDAHISAKELIIGVEVVSVALLLWRSPGTCLNRLWAKLVGREDTLGWWCEDCLGIVRLNLHLYDSLLPRLVMLVLLFFLYLFI